MVENSWEQRDNRPGYLPVTYRRRARVSYQQSTIVNRPKQDQQAHLTLTQQTNSTNFERKTGTNLELISYIKTNDRKWEYNQKMMLK